MHKFFLKERVPFREIMDFIQDDYQNLLEPIFQDPILHSKAKCDLFKNFSYRMLILITPTLLNELDCYDQKIYGYKLHTILFRDFNPLDNPLYRSFLKLLLQGGWHKTLHKYPLLKELLETNIRYWVEHIGEILARTKNDSDLISCFIGKVPSNKKGWLKRLELDKGDLHNQQRATAILVFPKGKVVYKPNSGKINLAYCDLSDWLKSYNAPYIPKKIACLDRGNYAWYQFIKKSPAKNSVEKRLFNYNLGCLASLMHVMGATDLHAENYFQSGVDPLIIDAECLMSSVFLDQRTHGILEKSVLRTGLLSYHIACSKTKKEEGSWGLGYETDKKNRLSDKFRQFSKTNRDAFFCGFLDMYAFLFKVKRPLLDTLNSENGALASFSSAQIRVVYKGTTLYFGMIDQSLFHLQSPKRMKKYLDALPHPYWVVEKTTRALRRQEIQEMQTQNIPHFVIRADQVDYPSKIQKKKVKIFKISPFDQFKKNVSELSISNLKKQFFLVKNAMNSDLGRLRKKYFSNIMKYRPFRFYFEKLTF